MSWFQMVLSTRPGKPQPVGDSSPSGTSSRTSAWEGVLLKGELVLPFLGGFLIAILIPATMAWLPEYPTLVLM